MKAESRAGAPLLHACFHHGILSPQPDYVKQNGESFSCAAQDDVPAFRVAEQLVARSRLSGEQQLRRRIGDQTLYRAAQGPRSVLPAALGGQALDGRVADAESDAQLFKASGRLFEQQPADRAQILYVTNPT